MNKFKNLLIDSGKAGVQTTAMNLLFGAVSIGVASLVSAAFSPKEDEEEDTENETIEHEIIEHED